MKILVANPNTSTGVTDRLVASGKMVASPGTELLPMPRRTACPTSPPEPKPPSAGPPPSTCWPSVAALDPAIIAAFGDPGLGGARDLFDFPVVGMAEAAMLIACTLGRPFGTVTSPAPWSPGSQRSSPGTACPDGAPASLPSSRACVRSAMFSSRRRPSWSSWPCAGSPTMTPTSYPGRCAALRPRQQIRDHVPVPLVDGIQAAVAWPRGWCAATSQGDRRHLPASGAEELQRPVEGAGQRDRSS